jgi:uncharacterized membrane protein
MKIGTYNLHLHSISVHFSIALYPVAIFFLLLSYFYKKDLSLFTYFHLMILATISVLFSFLTGIIEWKQKYKGVKVKIFTRKYRYSIFLFALGLLSTLWFGFFPGTVRDSGSLSLLFLFLNISILPLTVYLGFLGGKLIFGGAH